MARDFSRFRRLISGPFAGDAAPVGAQVLNDPATGVGNLFRIPLRRTDDAPRTSRTWQGYFRSTVFAGTLTVQQYVAAGLGTAAGDWILTGVALAAIPALTLVEGSFVEDADLVLLVTPSVPLIGGESVELFLEEVD